jgi:hypothetical protein
MGCQPTARNADEAVYQQGLLTSPVSGPTSMETQVTTAIAIGWLLLVPPVYPSNRHIVRNDLPLRYWAQIYAADDAAECQAQLDYDFSHTKPGQEHYEQFGLAICVASNDPRLAEK